MGINVRRGLKHDCAEMGSSSPIGQILSHLSAYWEGKGSEAFILLYVILKFSDSSI